VPALHAAAACGGDGGGGGGGLPSPKDRTSLRSWWHHVMRTHGRYSCYAFFLVLPSDKETIRYLTEFGIELNMISGEDCLVIVFGKGELNFSQFDEKLWRMNMEEQISKGYSTKVAELFNIGFDQFPCLVIFRDIRSPEHIIATLKDMKTEEISETMREVFSLIRQATTNKADALTAIENHRNQERLGKTGNTILSQIRSVAGKTLQTALEAWLKAIIK